LKDLLKENKCETLDIFVNRNEFKLKRCYISSNEYVFLKSPTKEEETLIELKEQLFRKLHKVSHDMRTPLNAIINML
jgi:signal transduction histidine kinase